MNHRAWVPGIVLALSLIGLAPFAAAQDTADAPAPATEAAEEAQSITLNLEGFGGRPQLSAGIKLLAMMTVLSLAPAILIMLTSFTRIVIVLSFVKRALSIQEAPPQQIIVGLSLFLTFFIMAPTLTAINRDAVQPYMAQELNEAQAFQAAEGHVRAFLFNHTRESDLATMYGLSKRGAPGSLSDVPTYVLAPAFMLSELKTAFTIGFIIFVPFLILDMVIASVLLSMGMMMLPPVIVSLPFKIILFVLIDGWNLVIGELVKSYG